MKNTFLGSLLHLSDPTLPIGGYSHSNGLETYVQKGLVNNTASAKKFIVQVLNSGLKFNDAAYMYLAYEAAMAADLECIIALDQELTALKCAREIRLASQKLGLRLMKVFCRHLNSDLTAGYRKAIDEKLADGHYCLAFGIYAHLMEIPLEEALFAFYYNAAVGLVTNSVKLVPLGQLDGQDILFSLQAIIKRLVTETIQLERSLVGSCNVGLDIRCMQHERLYSRLYMS